MSIHIQTINALPVSRNERDRQHWTSRHRELNEWVLMVQNCPQAHRQKPGTKRQVEIVFQKSRGPLSDPDNNTARAKVVLDALKHRGWIEDDSPRHIELSVSEVVTGSAATVIAVSEIVAEAA